MIVLLFARRNILRADLKCSTKTFLHRFSLSSPTLRNTFSAPGHGSFQAAIVCEKGGPFLLEKVVLKTMRENEVLVRVVASGMCHTDLVARDQQQPIPLPIIVGHEGSGIVEATGLMVEKVKPGDHVVLTFNTCGRCKPCEEGATFNCENFFPLNFLGSRPDHSHCVQSEHEDELHDRFFTQSSFAEYAVANERNVVKIRKDAPLELMGPLGCGIQTGAGAAINSLKVGPGNTIAIFGGGPVGLSAVLGAKVAGATTIFAVDIVDSRLELAKELGATHVINSKRQNPLEEIKKVTSKGVDFSIDTTANIKVLRCAIESLRSRGTCGSVGVPETGAIAEFDYNDLMINSKHIVGIIEGSAVTDVFIPKLVELYMNGKFPFDKLVKFYEFEDINQAAEDSVNGVTLKPILRIS